MHDTSQLPGMIHNDLARMEDKPKPKRLHPRTGSLKDLVPVRIDEHTCIYVPAERLEGAAERFKAKYQADTVAHIHSNKPY